MIIRINENMEKTLYKLHERVNEKCIKNTALAAHTFFGVPIEYFGSAGGSLGHVRTSFEKICIYL